MHRVYFNPNWDPEFYYPLLKPLLIFYDQVFVWNVSNIDLERYCDADSAGFLDFIADSHKNDDYPAMVPVGRESWFDDKSRKNAPQSSKWKQPDPRFVGEMRSYAERYNHQGSTGVLLNTDRDAPLEVLERAWNDDPDSLRKNARQAESHFGEAFMEHSVLAVAERYKFEKERAITNSYFQDVRAMQQIGCAAPIVKLGLLSDFQSVNWNYELRKQTELPNNIRLSTQGWVPSMNMGVTPDELASIIGKLHTATDFTWREVLEYRRSEKARMLRSYLRSHAAEVRLDSGKTLSKLIEADAKEAAASADAAATWALASGPSIAAGIVAAAATSGILGVASAATLGGLGLQFSDQAKGLVNLALDLLGVETKVHPFFSRLILRGERRILLDSPYMKSPLK
ncbi:MAG: hypothetical protein K2Y29_16505 [Beijerinckiaceae bacterium]|nr:hypothetical protein [Beijerinckiaceae bacterium]